MIPVVVRGMVRGRELTGDAVVSLEGGTVRLARPGAERAYLVLPLAALEGVRRERTQLVLYLDGGDVIELTAARGLGAFADEVLGVACALPELTRHLRAFGSRRALPRADHAGSPTPAAGRRDARPASAHADHDRFFAPLLRARRDAERARDPVAQVTAFDPIALRASLEKLTIVIAAERYPEHPPARRALEAELGECIEPLDDCFTALATAGTLVREEGDELRLAAWRGWSASLVALFACADRCWVSTAAVLQRAAYEPPDSWWRRMRRGGAR